MKLTLLVALVVAGGAYGACVDGCSGHGYCGAFDLCSCYPNWSGTNCGGRVCPYTKAWVDTAIADNDAHNYAECGNKGDCDGKSGQCKCFEGYEGKGCRRSSCPNDCSGHGICNTMRSLAANNHCPWDSASQARIHKCWDPSVVQIARSGWTTHPGESVGVPGEAVWWDATNEKFAGIQYDLWDADKIQGCVCDPGYAGLDCSGRICPKGDDPLRTRGPDSTDAYLDAPNQRHPQFDLHVGQSGTVQSVADGSDQFVLSFVDTYNERWYTRPIVLHTTGAAWAQAYDATHLTPLADNIKRALLDLPNGAVTGTATNPITGLSDASESLTVTCAQGGGAVGGVTFESGHSYKCTITFQSAHNSGNLLNRFSCHVLGCNHVGPTAVQERGRLRGMEPANPGGCFPKYNGIGAGRDSQTGELNAASTYNPNEDHADAACVINPVADQGTTDEDTCSGRGSCDGGSGECQCHEGYTDEDCHLQTVLV